MEQLQRLAASLGLPVEEVAGQEALIAAGAAIALAWIAAVLVGRYFGPRVRTWLEKRDAAGFQHVAGRARAIIASALAAILLVAASAYSGYGIYGRVLITVALGLALGRLVYSLARAMKLGFLLALFVGAVAATASVASSLGGLQPLIATLDNAALSIGDTRISLLDVLNAVIVIVLLYALAKFAAQLLSRSIGNARGLDLSQRVLFQKLAGVAVIAVAFFVGIELLGIDLTALAVFSGAFGLAVGFGMQKTFGNLLSGVILLIDRSIKPGDIIVVDDTFGWVNKIGVRAVSILTRDGIEYLIPNEILMTEQVENWSYSNRNVRIHIPVGVSYEADIKKARELMLQAAGEPARVLKSPAPAVWVTGFGESTIDHDIRVWISDAEEGLGSVKSAILTRIYELFKEHGVELPYPQRDVHVKTLPAGWEARPAKAGEDEAPS